MDKKKSVWQGSIGGVHFAVAGLAGIGTVLGFGGGIYWILDIFAHFRTQYLMGLLLGIVICLCFKRWRSLGIYGVLFGLNLMVVWPYLGAADGIVINHSADRVKILHFNVLSSNPKRRELIEYIDGCGADLVFLQEVTSPWVVDLLRYCKDSYRLEVEGSRADNFGVVMLVRKGWAGKVVRATWEVVVAGVDVELPVVMTEVEVNGKLVSIMGMHTIPPMRRELAELNKRQIVAARKWSDQQAGAHLLIGDLNATPWCAGFEDLVAGGKLRDSMLGFGFGRSWPTGLPEWIGIGLDHCLVSGEIKVINRELVGQGLGSDHRGLMLVLYVGRE